MTGAELKKLSVKINIYYLIDNKRIGKRKHVHSSV